MCSSFDCKDFNVSGPERMLPSQQYRLKADVSDMTMVAFENLSVDSLLFR